MKKYVLLTLLALVICHHSYAKENAALITTNIIEISMNSGYYNFDDNWDLPNSVFVGWGLGFQFTKAFRGVLNYSQMKTSSFDDNGFIAGSEDKKVQRYNADVSYTFFTDSSIRPYIAFSYGEIDLTYRLDGKQQKQDEQLGLGGGVLLKLSPKWFIRTDVRAVGNYRRSHIDVNSMVTFAYRLGLGEQ